MVTGLVRAPKAFYCSPCQRYRISAFSTDSRMTRISLDSAALADAAQLVREANLNFARRYAGEVAGRQPVHTVYGGAQLFNAQTPRKVGELAHKALEEYAPDAATLGN